MPARMRALPTPIVAAVIGEGGSGGALGVGVGDRLLILENAYYSVISPEGCAAILWDDKAHADKAAAALKRIFYTAMVFVQEPIRRLFDILSTIFTFWPAMCGDTAPLISPGLNAFAIGIFLQQI